MGEKTLMSWNRLVANEALALYQDRISALLHKHNGYLVRFCCRLISAALVSSVPLCCLKQSPSAAPLAAANTQQPFFFKDAFLAGLVFNVVSGVSTWGLCLGVRGWCTGFKDFTGCRHFHSAAWCSALWHRLCEAVCQAGLG